MMLLRINFKYTPKAPVASDEPVRTSIPQADQPNSDAPQTLYQRIAAGHALDEAEAQSRRKWQGR